MSSPEENLARYEELIPPLHDTQMALWKRVDEGMMHRLRRHGIPHQVQVHAR